MYLLMNGFSKTMAGTYFMPCTGQLGDPVQKASGRAQNTPFGPGNKYLMITDQHTRGPSKPIKPVDQALAMIYPFHKINCYIILTST